MARVDWQHYRHVITNSLPAQVLIAGTVITLTIGYYIYFAGYEKERLQFENDVEQIEGSVQDSMETYLALLHATRGYFYTNNSVDRQNFSRFAAELRLRDVFTGVQGVGYVSIVPASDVQRVEQEQRAQGATNFSIHPAGDASEYFPILYLEPPDSLNIPALGFDMNSRLPRREAMEKARDTGEATLSRRIVLLQQENNVTHPGFLLILPVYEGNQTPTDVEGRRAALEGYVYVPFRPEDFFADVFEVDGQPTVNMVVYDGDAKDEAQLLFRYQDEAENESKFELTKTVYNAGHPWTFVFSNKASANLATAISSERRLVPLLLASGLATTLLLFFIARSLVEARLQAEAFQLELMRVQINLQNSEARMRLVIDGIKDLAIITLSKTGLVTSWNPGADRFFGYSEKNILGKSYELFFSPQERRSKKPKRDLAEAIAKDSLEFERMMIRKNGTRFWANGLMSALHDKNGQLRGVAIIAQDVTNRKKSETLLRKQEQLTLAVMNSLPALIAVLDRTGKIVSTNRSWQEFMAGLHFKKSNLFGVGQNYLRNLAHSEQLMPKEFAQKATRGIEKVLAEKMNQFLFEYPITVRGEEQWFLLAATSLKHEDGGIAVSNTNITSLKTLDKHKDEFLSIASHELKTPITSARAYMQVLQRMQKGGKGVEASITQKVLAQIDKMQLLIADLLDVTKIEAGKLRMEKQKFLLDDLVHETVDAMRLITETHTISLEGKPNAIVVADRERIGQVITNLIDNAIKYSPESKIVRVDCSSNERQVKVSVTDYGLGISKKDQQKLFRRFFRVQQVASTTVYPGLGLGLYICAEIVHRSGGKLTVSSESGKGSTFTITLPLNKDSE